MNDELHPIIRAAAGDDETVRIDNDRDFELLRTAHIDLSAEELNHAFEWDDWDLDESSVLGVFSALTDYAQSLVSDQEMFENKVTTASEDI